MPMVTSCEPPGASMHGGAPPGSNALSQIWPQKSLVKNWFRNDVSSEFRHFLTHLLNRNPLGLDLLNSRLNVFCCFAPKFEFWLKLGFMRDFFMASVTSQAHGHAQQEAALVNHQKEGARDVP